MFRRRAHDVDRCRPEQHDEQGRQDEDDHRHGRHLRQTRRLRALGFSNAVPALGQKGSSSAAMLNSDYEILNS
jgi:hypothetical protein